MAAKTASKTARRLVSSELGLDEGSEEGFKNGYSDGNEDGSTLLSLVLMKGLKMAVETKSKMACCLVTRSSLTDGLL